MSRHKTGPATWVEDVDPYAGLTQRQRHVLEVVRAYGGNRSRAARRLGINVAGVQASLRLCAAAGVTVPPRITRRGIPNHNPSVRRPRCGRTMARQGTCGRIAGHTAHCISVAAWERQGAA